MRALACLSAALALFAAPLPAAVITVGAGGDCATIQEGIDLSASGDTVLVLPGTYTGPQNRNLNPGSRSIVLRSQAGADSTIIDCEAASRAFYFGTAVDSLATVEGFTITNGQEAAGDGGALRIASGASPTIRSCVFVGNSAVNGGAVLCHSGTAPRFFDCVFSGNEASGWGGAMQCRLSSPLVVNCHFTGNTAAEGGAIWGNDSDLTLSECTLSQNISSDTGGGMVLKSASICSASDCILDHNVSTSGSGGAIFCDSNSPLELRRTGIEDNTASMDGGGVLLANSSSCEMDSTWFFRNGAGYRGGALAAQNSTVSASVCTFDTNTATLDGGGLYLSGAGPDTVRTCSFAGNAAGQDGGGVYIQGPAVTMSDCVFDGGNEAGDDGGGLHVNGTSTGTYTGCLFLANTARSGGGVALHTSPLTLSDMWFEDNTGTLSGGGLYAANSAASVTGCTFVGNSASDGGGVRVVGEGCVVTGCTFVGNAATSAGSAIVIGSAAAAAVSNSIMAFGVGAAPVYCATASPTITHCDVYGNAVTDSLSGDYHDNGFWPPQFCDKAGNDFTLCADSQCLPDNNAWNELVGAHGQGCPDCESPVPPTSWGAIKALFR